MPGGVRRSSVVVGRRPDLDRLRGAVGDAATGASGCLFLTGEGGIGKSRLLNETVLEARRRGVAVLLGRAGIGAPVSFGVIAEAVRSWLRAGAGERPPSVYDRGLQLVLPEWPAEAPASGLTDSQLRLLALEGLVDLVRSIGAERGVLVFVDDLHAADAESLDALRYLVSAAVPGVVVVATSRVAESALADQLLDTLAHQGLADPWPIDPLPAGDVGDLLTALLGTRPPGAFVEEVLARADGIPLFVEEIVDAHLRVGSLAVEDRGVRWRGGVNVVPRTVAAMVASRLDRLPDTQRDVLTAAAIAGAGDAELLALMAAQPAETVVRALAAAVDAGLLETVGGRVEFRHAVVGEAVREHALPEVVRAMHRRAAAALAPAASGNDSALERLASHLAGAGDADGAGRVLVDASEASRRGHALLRAEALALQARALATADDTRVMAADALAAAWASQGRWAEALALDEETASRHGYAPERWTRMARCALDSRQTDVVRRLADDAGAVEDVASPYFEVMRGRLAMARGDADAALASARHASAESVADPATVCDALDLEARALDYLGERDGAAAAWERQQEAAAAAGLTAERIRGLVSMAELELFEAQPPRRMYEAVEVARNAGALVEQAWATLNLSVAITVQGDPTTGLRLAEEGIELCQRHRLDLLPFLLVTKAGAKHMLGTPDFEDALAEARAAVGDGRDATIHASGIAGDHAMHLGRYDDAIVHFQRACDALLAEPGGIPSDTPYWIVLVLHAAGRVDEARAALEVARQTPDALRWPGSQDVLAVAEAVFAGDEAAVDSVLEAAEARRLPFDHAVLRVLAAEILRGPSRARWLREALDLYEAHDGFLAIDRVRGLLREAGGAVPRGKRTAKVPAHLITYGVTAREAEVLDLVEQGLSNAAVAEKLFLSVRTVESHVSSLLSKLGVASRADLATFAATH